MNLIQAVAVTLVIGAGLGLIIRQVLRTRTHLGWAESVVSGIVGSWLGLFVNLKLTGHDRFVSRGWDLLAATIGTVIAMLLLTAVTRPKDRTAEQLLAAGENARTEFKSTARYNIHTKQRDEKLEMVISKTVAALANSDGGVLFIGVDDSGTPIGLDDDYALVKAPDSDRFELWLRDHLTRTIGAAATTSLSVDFPVVDGTQICMVRIPRSRRPVYLRPSKDRVEMWVRVGNSTRQLPIDEALSYAADRWGRRVLR